MEAAILARVCRAVGVPDLVERLSTHVAPGDLQALLLELARRRAGSRTPAELLEQHRRDSFVAAAADAAALARLTLAAYAACPGYEPVELAPVEPLGLNTVLASIDQNRVLACARSTEVVSDPTSALALVAAARRRDGEGVVRLCASQRVLRAQRVEPPLRQHFRLFALVTAARARPDHGAEVEALREHVAAHLGIVAAAGGDAQPARAAVRLSDTVVHAALAERGVRPAPDAPRLHEAIPAAERRRLGRRLRRLEAAIESLRDLPRSAPRFDLLVDLTRTSGVGYYRGLQLRIDVPVDGGPREIADGGSVEWSAQLLSDRREQLFTSGLALERLLP